MEMIYGQNNVVTMLKMYKRVQQAQEVEIRDQKCRNVHNMCVLLNTDESILTSFKARNLNLNYCKKEWLWYLGADPKDDSIQEHAKLWEKLRQDDGSFFSNYGQYMFGDPHLNKESQFFYVINELARDRNSRRASIVLLKQEHLFKENVDTVCTYAVNFTIQGDLLHMTVMMRSNDVIFGFTNDAFCFWQLYEFAYAILRSKYERLQRGTYTHFVNSMHVYEKHYKMIANICADTTMGGYDRIDVPRPTLDEAVALIKTRGTGGEGVYCDWLRS